MGSILYGHLNSSILLDPTVLNNDFEDVSDNELLSALAAYRAFCIANLSTLLDEVGPEQHQLRLYVGDVIDARLLKQAAFYLDTVIIEDPLFRMTPPEHEFTRVWSTAFDIPKSDRPNRKDVARAARALLSFRSLVAAGYVRFFPTSLNDETPEELPIYAPDDGFEGLLPAHLSDLYKKAANVRSVVSSPDGLLVRPTLDLGRRIHIDFDGPGNGQAFGFDLVQQETHSLDHTTGRASVSMSMPKEPPSKEMFDAWVSQSINSSARQHFDSLCQDVAWSTRFGSQLLTRSTFAASVLDSSQTSAADTIVSATTNGLLNLDLPVFDDTSLEDLMAARSDEEAFRRFRRHMEKHFRELRMETDPEKRHMKTENAMHELVDVQLTEVDSAIHRLRKRGVLSGLGGIVSLGAVISTSGVSLIGTLAAVYAGWRTVEEYRIAAKENPAYFLWRATKAQRPS